MFFSVFSCFSACRNKSVILAFLGFSGPLPCFTSLLCLIWPAVCPVCPSRGCAFSSRGALFVSGREVGPACFRLPVGCAVSVSVGVGCGVPVAPSCPVWPSQVVEQVFDLRHSNKFSKHLFEWLFGLGWQNFQPNLTEY